MSNPQVPDPDRCPAHMRALWDDAAATFDEEPDHGLRDPVVRAAWMEVLTAALPPAPVIVLDIGCGTGSLSVVLAELGYCVTGIDLSPQMIARAEAKAQAAQQPITFHVMDGASPQFPAQHVDVIVCRHVLWALPGPDQVLRRWVDLLKPGGRLLLIEGYWSTGGGLHADDLITLLPDAVTGAQIRHLSDQAVLWGKPVTDERYLITALRPS